MAQKKLVTITDVARAAGVALGTVSRVFNNVADVNPDTQEKVWQTARELGYRRIRQRRGAGRNGHDLRNGLHADIGVVVFGMEDTLVQVPVVSSALQGIEHALAGHGHTLMLANIPTGDRIPPFLAEGRVAGLILKGPNQGDLPPESDTELLRSAYRVPHVWLMGRLPGAQGDHVNFDTEVAGRLAATHLREKGHRRVAFFNPKPGQIQFEKLKNAFLVAALRLGLDYSLLELEPPPTRAWPLPAITLEENVDLLVQRWSAIPAGKRPTALFVPSDRTAVQLYSALERAGLHVGTDIGLVSCNNEKSLLMNLHPGLTTIDIHADDIGRRAVDQLLWRIRHPLEPLSLQILVDPTLVERGSVPTR